MISIITRCRNRLEYTAQVLDAVKRNTHIDYEHIIIDNASEDGTFEWFKWMAKNSWYDRVKYFRMPRNTGDWGGMLAGFREAKGEYIVQLDNDVIPCEKWLSAMKTALENTDFKVVMLKRANVFGKWVLKCLDTPKNVEGLHVCRVERAVACYMMHRDDFSECAKHIPESLGMKSKYIMAGLTKHWEGLKIGKILNMTCHELQADEKMILTGLDQRKKYSPKNPQIWEKV